MLTSEQIDQFRSTGHLTAEGVFDDSVVASAIDDVASWSREFLNELAPDDKQWYLEPGSANAAILRKLDNPVFHRPLFRKVASDPTLVEAAQQLIGPGVSVFFSQVFMKPPEVGGPKPIHQDNYYFGPDRLDATLTVWIALDQATTENGCLYYSDTHLTEILPHVAPPDQPFNLQVPAEIAAGYELRPAPVPGGGVSFHHGNTLHQSSSNRSDKARRAVAIHYLRNDASLVRPALSYDSALRVPIT